MEFDLTEFIKLGCIEKLFLKNTTIFKEDEEPRCFYIVKKGGIRLFSTNNDGKEITQGLFFDNQTFGEPPILLGKRYPSTAIALIDSIIIKIPKEIFIETLDQNHKIIQTLLFTFAERIYNKAMNIQILNSNNPEEKIIKLFNIIKGVKTERIRIEYTRQQIADLTGLRVETVIRTLGKLNEKKTVEIIKHKVYF